MTFSASPPQLSVANKAPGTEGQQQANGEKKETPAVPSAPPSYEEATSGEGLKAGASREVVGPYEKTCVGGSCPEIDAL